MAITMNGMKTAALSGAFLLLSGGLPAQAQVKARPDPIADCERFATAISREDGNPLTSIRIDRDLDRLIVNRFEHRVGGVMVPVEYMGWADIAYAGQTPERVRFVCLHTGDRGRAIYTALIPNDL